MSHMTHFAPFFAVADHRDQDPLVAYYALKDVATYLSRSRSRSRCQTVVRRIKGSVESPPHV